MALSAAAEAAGTAAARTPASAAGLLEPAGAGTGLPGPACAGVTPRIRRAMSAANRAASHFLLVDMIGTSPARDPAAACCREPDGGRGGTRVADNVGASLGRHKGLYRGPV